MKIIVDLCSFSLKNIEYWSDLANTAELCSQQSLIEILFSNWPDEHVEEVDEGKLDEGGEDGHEAHDDEHVEGGGVGNLQRISTSNILIYDI